jgi:hypothetical protein
MSRGKTRSVGYRCGPAPVQVSDLDADWNNADLCAFSEVRGELGMPGPGLLRHCTLGGHALFDCPPTVITLIRFHRPRLPEGSLSHRRTMLNDP